MVRRFWTFALTLVIAAAPVAATMCQVTCASHEGDVGPEHAHHHQTVPASTSIAEAAIDVGMKAVPHVCQHQQDDAVAIQQALQVLAAPAMVIVDAFVLQPAGIVMLTVRATDIEQSPPEVFALTAQLRV